MRGLLTVLWHGPARRVVGGRRPAAAAHGRPARPGRRAVPRPRHGAQRGRASACCGSVGAGRTTSTCAGSICWRAADLAARRGADALRHRSAIRSVARSPSRPRGHEPSGPPASSRWPPSRPAARWPASWASVPLLLLHGERDELLPPAAARSVDDRRARRMVAGRAPATCWPGRRRDPARLASWIPSSLDARRR